MQGWISLSLLGTRLVRSAAPMKEAIRSVRKTAKKRPRPFRSRAADDATISSMLDQLDIESEFMDGLRVTSKETVSVAEMVLCGKINKEIVQLLQNRDINAVGISGKDGGMLRVKKKLSHGKDIGYVGEITRVKDAILQDMLRNDYVPVIAPIGYDRNKQTYNINADHVAYAIAKKLKAEKLIYLTDTEFSAAFSTAWLNAETASKPAGCSEANTINLFMPFSQLRIFCA